MKRRNCLTRDECAFTGVSTIMWQSQVFVKRQAQILPSCAGLYANTVRYLFHVKEVMYNCYCYAGEPTRHLRSSFVTLRLPAEFATEQYSGQTTQTCLQRVCLIKLLKTPVNSLVSRVQGVYKFDSCRIDGGLSVVRW